MSAFKSPFKKKRRRLPHLICGALVLMFLYSNCSEFATISPSDSRGGSQTLSSMTPNEGNSSPGAGGSNPVGGDGSTSTPSPALMDASGVVNGYQDRDFVFELSSLGSGGNYALVSTAPSWLNLNTVTGRLSGRPPAMAEFQLTYEVTLKGQRQRSNPISFRILGNPFKSFQWHLENNGQTTFSRLGGANGFDLNLKESIASGLSGEGIRVAVSDTGFVQSHPNLVPNLIAGSRNYLTGNPGTMWAGDSTPNLSTDPTLAHGTAVAGLIAERGWSGSGGRGAAPFASIAGFLFIQAQQRLSSQGLLTAAYLNQYEGNFDIFNYSWGDPQCALSAAPAGLSEKLQVGVTQFRGGRGAIYVKAGGNDFAVPLQVCFPSAAASDLVLGNTNFSFENNTPYMIVVGAFGAQGRVASYSSPGASLWISAPGGEGGSDTSTNNIFAQPAMLTTDGVGCGVGLKSRNINNFDRGQAPNTLCHHVASMNGTSSAAPLVSGSVALLLQANPNLSWRDVKHILASTARLIDPNASATSHPRNLNLAGHIYEQGWVTNAAGFRFHNWYGFGAINVDAAVNMAKSYAMTLGPQRETNSNGTWKYTSPTLNANIPDASVTGFTHRLSVTENWIVESVQISPNIQNCVGQMGIELTSPRGTKSIILPINSGLRDSNTSGALFLSNAFYGETSQGEWALKVIDGSAGCQGTLANWRLNIIGR